MEQRNLRSNQGPLLGENPSKRIKYGNVVQDQKNPLSQYSQFKCKSLFYYYDIETLEEPKRSSQGSRPDH